MERTITINNKAVEKAVIIENKQGKIVKITFPFTLSDGSNTDTLTVHKDEEGHEYVYIINFDELLKDPKHDLMDSYLFVNTPADAINYVKNGVADALIKSNIFDSVFHVSPRLDPILFIDREFGNKIREEVIKGWPTVTYKWALVFKSRHAISPIYNFLRKDYNDNISRVMDNGQRTSLVLSFFVNELSCDRKGNCKGNNDDIPDSSLYLADTKEEIKELIPKIQKQFSECYDKFGYDASNYILNFSWEPYQYLIFED